MTIITAVEAAHADLLQDVTNSAAMIAASKATVHRRGVPAIYPSTYDFVLHHWQPMEWAASPEGVEYGLPKQCYYNAFLLAEQDPERYIYCEGFAAGIIPVHHAWNYDRKTGMVVETTWRRKEDEEAIDSYLGVPFKWRYVVEKFLAEDDYFCVIDRWWDHWPLLTGIDKVADAIETLVRP